MELLASCDCLSDWLTDWGCEKAQPGRQCSVIRLSPVEQTPPPPCQSLQSLLSPHPDSFIPSSSGRILQSHYQLILDILRRKIWCHLTFRTLSFSPSPRPTPPPALPLDCTLYMIQDTGGVRQNIYPHLQITPVFPGQLYETFTEAERLRNYQYYNIIIL